MCVLVICLQAKDKNDFNICKIKTNELKLFEIKIEKNYMSMSELWTRDFPYLNLN